MDLGTKLRRNERIGRFLDSIMKKFVGARKPENESRVHGLPYSPMDFFLTSPVCDHQRRHLCVVTQTGQLLERLLSCDGQAFQFANHEFHHVVGEIPGLNLRQILVPGRSARVELYKAFFGEGGEKLDHKEWVARSFFVHESRKRLGRHPITTKSICDKVVHVRGKTMALCNSLTTDDFPMPE